MIRLNLIKKVLKNTAVFATVIVMSLGTTGVFTKATTWANYAFAFNYAGYVERTSPLYKSVANDYVTMETTYVDIPDIRMDAVVVSASNDSTTYSSVVSFYGEEWHMFYNWVPVSNTGTSIKIKATLVDDYGWDGAYVQGYWHSDSGISQ